MIFDPIMCRMTKVVAPPGDTNVGAGAVRISATWAARQTDQETAPKGHTRANRGFHQQVLRDLRSPNLEAGWKAATTESGRFVRAASGVRTNRPPLNALPSAPRGSVDAAAPAILGTAGSVIRSCCILTVCDSFRPDVSFASWLVGDSITGASVASSGHVRCGSPPCRSEYRRRRRPRRYPFGNETVPFRPGRRFEQASAISTPVEKLPLLAALSARFGPPRATVEAAVAPF